MKKFVFLLVALLLGAGAASAQSNLLNDLKRQASNAVRSEVNKAKNNAQRNARNAATNAVKGAVNNAKNGAYSNNNRTNQQLTDGHVHAEAEGWTCPECGHAGNDGKFCSNCGAKRPAEEVKTSNGKSVWTCPTCGKADNEGSFCANCGTDRPDGNVHQEEKEATGESVDEEVFVPGKTVIFEDTLSGEKIDADPSKWELLAASMYQCYVTRQAGDLAIWLNGFHSDMKPKMRKENYLPDTFTVELDIWFEEKVANAQSHALELNFGSEDALEEFSAIFRFGADEEESGAVALRYYGRLLAGERLIEEKDKVRALLKPGAWNRAAVSFDNGTVMLFVNGKSVLKATGQKQPTYVRVDAVGSDRDHFVFKNFRIATN